MRLITDKPIRGTIVGEMKEDRWRLAPEHYVRLDDSTKQLAPGRTWQVY